MSKGERISLLVMRDTGHTRRYRLPKKLLYWGITLCLLMIPVALCSSWFAYTAWDELLTLRSEHHKLKSELATTRAAAIRLKHLEELVLVPPQEHVQRDLATQHGIKATAATTPPPKVAAPLKDNEPGDTKLSHVDTGTILIQNVSVRVTNQERLRISLDIRNPKPGEAIAGNVVCLLFTAAGETSPLNLQPSGAGLFRISRLKRAVFTATPNTDASLEDAQIIIEVQDSADKVIYRNIYPIAH